MPSSSIWVSMLFGQFVFCYKIGVVLQEGIPWAPDSKATCDGRSKADVKKGINANQFLALLASWVNMLGYRCHRSTIQGHLRFCTLRHHFWKWGIRWVSLVVAEKARSGSSMLWGMISIDVVQFLFFQSGCYVNIMQWSLRLSTAITLRLMGWCRVQYKP